MINLRKKVMYDHNVDQKSYKWSGKSILKKIDNKSCQIMYKY